MNIINNNTYIRIAEEKEVTKHKSNRHKDPQYKQTHYKLNELAKLYSRLTGLEKDQIAYEERGLNSKYAELLQRLLQHGRTNLLQVQQCLVLDMLKTNEAPKLIEQLDRFITYKGLSSYRDEAQGVFYHMVATGNYSFKRLQKEYNSLYYNYIGKEVNGKQYGKIESSSIDIELLAEINYLGEEAYIRDVTAFEKSTVNEVLEHEDLKEELIALAKRDKKKLDRKEKLALKGYIIKNHICENLTPMEIQEMLISLLDDIYKEEN